MFSLLFYSTVDIYLDGSVLLSHFTGVLPRDQHNDDIGDLIVLFLKTLFSLSLLTITETVLLHREGSYTLGLCLCALLKWKFFYHRTFQVTGKGFTMVAASVFNMKLFTSCENAALESSLLLLHA